MIREELAVIEQRTRQWRPEAADPGPRWAGGCPYRGLLPYDQAHEAVFFGRERLTAELAGKLAGTGIVMVTGASGAGKTSLLQAGLVPALARGVQVPGSSSWPVISLTATARPLTDLAAGLASLGGAGSRRGPADAGRRARRSAPADPRDLMAAGARAPAGADHRPVRAGLRGRRTGREAGADGVHRRGVRGGDPTGRVAGRAPGPGGDRGPRGLLGPVRRLPSARPGHGARSARGRPDAGSRLRRAITGPAEVSGLRVDSALIDAIVADVRRGRRRARRRGAPAALPGPDADLGETRRRPADPRRLRPRGPASPAPSRSAPRPSTPGCPRTSRRSRGTCSGG